MAKGNFVIREKKTQKVLRVLNWQGTSAHVILRHDSQRLQLIPTLQSIKGKGIDFTDIKKIHQREVKAQPVELANGTEIAYVECITDTAENLKIKDENIERYPFILRWSAIAHLSLLTLILIFGLVIEPWLEPEEAVVTIIKQSEIERPVFDKKTVSVSRTKIDRTKKVSRKKITKSVKTKKYAKKSRRSNTRTKKGQARTRVNVAKTGALGVLGGLQSGSKKSSGLNLNSASTSRGSGVSGKGGAGGHDRALPGKGLVAAGVGTGGKAQGSGGYGTKGKGGGKAGYGKLSMAGSSGAYFQPLQEEALIQGGLDRDQIDAVIKRHMGQVIYCYEKGLQVNPSVSGRVTTQFVINGGGRVSTAKIGSSSLRSSTVESCLLNKLRGWKFPRPHGGVNVKVSYPFNLRRVSQG